MSDETKSGQVTQPPLEHEWLLVFSTGHDAPGCSLDTIEQCARCGAMRHDYRHNGGQTSPHYPRIVKYGVAIDRDAPCLGLLGAARSVLTPAEHANIGAGGGDD